METLLDPCWGIVQKSLLRGVDFYERRLPTNKELRISLCSYTALATQITYVMMLLQHPDHRGRPQDTAYFWERIEAPLPPLRPRCNFIQPKQLSPFP